MDISSILYFYTKDCDMCRQFESVLKKFEEKNEGEVTRVNVEENEDTKVLFEELARDVCVGVPFLYNEENGRHVCGFVEISEIEKILS